MTFKNNSRNYTKANKSISNKKIPNIVRHNKQNLEIITYNNNVLSRPIKWYIYHGISNILQKTDKSSLYGDNYDFENLKQIFIKYNIECIKNYDINGNKIKYYIEVDCNGFITKLKLYTVNKKYDNIIYFKKFDNNILLHQDIFINTDNKKLIVIFNNNINKVIKYNNYNDNDKNFVELYYNLFSMMLDKIDINIILDKIQQDFRYYNIKTLFYSIDYCEHTFKFTLDNDNIEIVNYYYTQLLYCRNFTINNVCINNN